MEQQAFIAAVHYLIQFYVKVDILLRPFLFQRHNGLPYLLVKTEYCALWPDRLVVDLGQQQDVARQRGQPPGVEQDFFNVCLLLLRRLVVILQERGVPLTLEMKSVCSVSVFPSSLTIRLKLS